MSTPDPDVAPKYTGYVVSALSFLSALLMFLKNHSSWSKRIEELEEWKTETTTTLDDLHDQVLNIADMKTTVNRIESRVSVLEAIEHRLKKIEESHDRETLVTTIVTQLVTKLEPHLKKN